MSKLKLLFFMDVSTRLLLVEAFIYLGRARILKGLPFSRVSPSLGVHMGETAYSYNEVNKKVLKQISDAINIMSKYTFWKSQCLVKAIAAMKMLERRNIESTLYLGTAKDSSGKLIAHAWLRSGPFCVTGSEGKEKFTVVSKFAKQIGVRMNEEI